MTLEERRAEWEEDMEPVCELENRPGQNLLVILQLKNPGKSGGLFWCHRYFKIVDNWEVSVDRSCVELPLVWRWLESMVN
jgi:hypothetical protein